MSALTSRRPTAAIPEPASLSIALRSAGTLSVLIFLISAIYEVLVINHLHPSQHGLIGLLLAVLALWAWLEIGLLNQRRARTPLGHLQLLLGIQLGLILSRHGLFPQLWSSPSGRDATAANGPSFEQAILFLPIYLLLILAIAQCLINAFGYAERLQSQELRRQMQLLATTRSELAGAQQRELEEAERQRSLLEHKLKSSLAAAAVVHEIQQPLAAILLNCHLARDNLAAEPPGSMPPWLEPLLDGLTSSSDQVVDTMNRMRLLLRNVQTEASPMELSSMLDSALTYLQMELQPQLVSLRREGLDQRCLMHGDVAQLQIAVVNLIRNALQAMAALPCGRRQLLLQLDRQVDRVRILVADSGPGFADGVSGEPSWEVLKSSKATGMGIGLFLAQTAASNHHGHLHIGRSAALGGAEVVIELPLRRQGGGAATPAG